MRATLSLAVLLTTAASSHAAKVETLRSYWDDDHSAIWSDVRVVHDDGSVEVRQELGGTVDDITMVQIAQTLTGNQVLEFVPTRDLDGARVHWSTSCVFITPDSAGTSQIDGTDELTAIQAAADAWNSSTSACSYQRFIVDPPRTVEVGYDGTNVVKFREDRWCRPARGSSPEKCYDEGATAITTLFYIKEGHPGHGTLLDADIEVNSVDYAMAVGCETSCRTNATHGIVEDLQNTITHEMGHVLGLDHTCWPLESAPPLDDQGNPAPACRPQSALPAEVVNATMYTFQDPMETKKRSPEQDDVDGVCTNYPVAQDPGQNQCKRIQIDSGGCCSVAGPAGGGRRDPRTFALLGLLVAAFAAVRVRACSRSRRR